MSRITNFFNLSKTVAFIRAAVNKISQLIMAKWLCVPINRIEEREVVT